MDTCTKIHILLNEKDSARHDPNIIAQQHGSQGGQDAHAQNVLVGQLGLDWIQGWVKKMDI
jgi:hypothetical protein